MGDGDLRFELDELGVSGGPGGGGGLRLVVVVVSGDEGAGDDCLDIRSETLRKTLRLGGVETGSMARVQNTRKAVQDGSETIQSRSRSRGRVGRGIAPIPPQTF